MSAWDNLLLPPDGREASLQHFSVLHKRGHPFLYLPKQRALTDATMRLYPAQTLRARTMVRVASLLIRVGSFISSKEITVHVSQHSAFGAFLKKLLPDCNDVPAFGVLGGNVKTPGRRYTFLLFDENSQPSVVVKVGITPEARQLIKLEQAFFSQQHHKLPGLPEMLDMYQGEDASAIAYRYVEGTSPTPQQEAGIEKLLRSWISNTKPIPFSELPIWQELSGLRKDNPGLKSVFQALQNARIRPVLFHGDFAPWNIRVATPSQKNNWVVLDWERSCAQGIPGWDWFHYIIQYNTMVEHSSPKKTLSDMEALWKSPAFIRYAQATGIEGIVKEITFIYFLYLLRYFAPRDHTAKIYRLAEKFQQTYFKDLTLSRPSLKISVITPSYRQLAWLKLCVASVTDQREASVEHIIQDAESGPELENWVRENSKAHLFVEADSGMYDGINRGFSRATGDIICWLNSDEQYLEGALAKVIHYFEAHPDVDVLFSDALLIGNTGALLSYRRTIFPNLHHIQLSHLNVPSCAIFVRRSVLNRGYRLDTRWHAIADAIWVSDLLKSGVSMAVLNEPLAAFTLSDKNLGQSSLTFTEAQRWQEETMPGKLWLKPFLISAHRLKKLFHGAYWPRSFTVRLYTLSSSKERTPCIASFLSFKWPQSK